LRSSLESRVELCTVDHLSNYSQFDYYHHHHASRHCFVGRQHRGRLDGPAHPIGRRLSRRLRRGCRNRTRTSHLRLPRWQCRTERLHRRRSISHLGRRSLRQRSLPSYVPSRRRIVDLRSHRLHRQRSRAQGWGDIRRWH